MKTKTITFQEPHIVSGKRYEAGEQATVPEHVYKALHHARIPLAEKPKTLTMPTLEHQPLTITK